MWRFNYGANRLLDSTFVICRPLICTNWIYIVWECSYFFNLPLNRQISACSWSVHFIHFRSFKPPQSFLVTVCRSKPPQPFHPLLNWSTSLRFPERGLGGKIKWHCLPLTWHSKPKCAIPKLKHIGFIHYTTRFGFWKCWTLSKILQYNFVVLKSPNTLQWTERRCCCPTLMSVQLEKLISISLGREKIFCIFTHRHRKL